VNLVGDLSGEANSRVPVHKADQELENRKEYQNASNLPRVVLLNESLDGITKKDVLARVGVGQGVSLIPACIKNICQHNYDGNITTTAATTTTLTGTCRRGWS